MIHETSRNQVLRSFRVGRVPRGYAVPGGKTFASCELQLRAPVTLQGPASNLVGHFRSLGQRVDHDTVRLAARASVMVASAFGRDWGRSVRILRCLKAFCPCTSFHCTVAACMFQHVSWRFPKSAIYCLSVPVSTILEVYAMPFSYSFIPCWEPRSWESMR